LPGDGIFAESFVHDGISHNYYISACDLEVGVLCKEEFE